MNRFTVHQSLFFVFVFLNSCIGDDLINDRVPAEIRILNPIVSIKEGEQHQYKAKFFNAVGIEESSKSLFWKSDNTSVATISNNGLLHARVMGNTTITASTKDIDGNTIQISDELEVSMESVMENNIISGTLRTTSSYTLEGSFRMTKTESALTLELLEDYRADTALPGLVVFLGNNQNTVQGAYRIASVTHFDGAHSYNLPASIGLKDYKYILYWCEPFNVSVGEGILIP